MIDLICAGVLVAVGFFVAKEGIWGAAQTFLCTLLAGLIAMNYFEPLAAALRAFMPEMWCDLVALLGLFIGLVFALRMGTERLAQTYIQVFPALDTAGKWVMGAATGYLTLAILLTALHTAPLPREFLGFTPERPNFFGMAPDRQWLGFTQYVSEKPLGVQYRDKIGDKEIIVAHAFDGRYEKVGDPMKPYSVKDLSGQDAFQIIWPSFPIRYATRRGQMGSGGSSAPAAAPVQVVPQQQPQPGPGGAPAPVGF
jgi:hypothetical protein